MTKTTGTIVGIEDHGTIVSLVIAETPEQVAAGVGCYIHLDHSPFRWILEAEGCTPADLIGRTIHHDDLGIVFTDRTTFCNTAGCDNACEGPKDDICLKCQKELEEENERYECGTCGYELSENGHCHNCERDVGEYDSARDRDFDRETDAINEARWEREGI